MTVSNWDVYRDKYWTAIGSVTNNIALWMSVGLNIGLCFGVAISANKDNDSKK